MKKSIVTVVIFIALIFIEDILISACSTVPKNPPEKGSLKGNVFWKYNNYVGNKPDAGASITLYSLFDTSFRETAACDVQGNYSIDSIPAGNYFVVVASKVTNESPSSALDNIYIQGAVLKTIARDSLQGLKEVRDSITILGNANEEIEKVSSPYERIRKRKEIQDSIDHISRRWFDARTPTAMIRLGKIIATTPKVKYNLITIKPKRTETLITDFGITYY